MGKVKSLRDCVLEFTVVNFDKIFFENGGAKQVKKHICLPPMLFEDIQNKSKKMCWIIPPKSLIACFSNRDALNWVNIDLRVGALTLDDMLQIEKSDFPIKRLSFRTTHLTDAMLDVIEKFSSTIEVLEIDYHYAPEHVAISDKSPNQSVIKFPKLKVLFINFCTVPVELLKRFDLSSCSESLKKLCLFGYYCLPHLTDVEHHLIMNFIDSIKVLQNLESLTINNNCICIKMNTIAHLKNLRTLNLPAKPSNIPPGQSLVNILPKLENLTLSDDDDDDDLICELNSLNGKTLNYVGSWSLKDIPEHLKQVSKNFGSLKDFQSFLTLMDYSCCYYEYVCNASVLLLMLPKWFDDKKDKTLLFNECDKIKAEKAILVHTMFKIGLDQSYADEYMSAKYEYLWSHDFIIKMTNLVTSLKLCDDKIIQLKYQPFTDFKKGYIALNPNSSISQLYKMGMDVESF